MLWYRICLYTLYSPAPSPLAWESLMHWIAFQGNWWTSQDPQGFFSRIMTWDLRTLSVGLFQAARGRTIPLSRLSVIIRLLQSSGVKNRSKVAVLVGCNASPPLAQGEDVKSGDENPSEGPGCSFAAAPAGNGGDVPSALTRSAGRRYKLSPRQAGLKRTKKQTGNLWASNLQRKGFASNRRPEWLYSKY